VLTLILLLFETLLVPKSVRLLPRTPTPKSIPKINPSNPSKAKIPQQIFLHGLVLASSTLKEVAGLGAVVTL